MRCPGCQRENVEQAKLCAACGTRLHLTCAKCGIEVPTTAKFCPECAHQVPPRSSDRLPFESPDGYTPPHLAEKILSRRTAIEGEHKQVTILFCDLCDSTALAERLGSEAMYTLLNRFFEVALAEVHRYEGTINQFLGDGFMALFGAPLAHEDHAKRAVLAAIGIRRALRERHVELGHAHGVQLSARMGLNTGLVVVGKIGDNLRMDYTAVGDTTNVAARLQQLADPDTILAAEGTHRVVRDYVRMEVVGPVHIKGRTESVLAYKVLGLGLRRSPLQRSEGRPLSPFVGRIRELAGMQDLLAQVEGGHGQAVGIVGEPGMGKSRLLLEFQQTQTKRRATYLEGRCLSYGSAIPYLPVLDILRNNCGITEVDSTTGIIDKVRYALQEVGMTPEEWAPFLLDVLGVKNGTDRLSALSPEAIKARTFETLRHLSLRGGRQRPLIFAVEDLQWVDRTSEDFFTLLVESLPGAPILFLSTYRPGYRPPWMEKSYSTQIPLQPLSPQDSLSVVQSVLPTPQVHGPLAQVIIAKAEGNPFFLEELARSMGERSDLAPILTVPDTLQGVITARIDRLPDRPKQLLQTASVLGREFSLRLLGTVWEGPEPFEPHLRELMRLEFLHEQIGPEEPTYVFKHALTQEVAYGSLLERYRRPCHGTVGFGLEGLYAGRTDEVVELLAHHFGRSAESEKAIDYAILAAEKAQRRWANIEALAYFEAALKRLEGMPDTGPNRLRRIDAVIKQAEVKFALGRHAEHIQALEGIRSLVAGIADPQRSAAWHYWAGFLHSLTGGRPEVAIEHCRTAVSIADAAGIDEIPPYAESCLAQIYAVAGDPRRAVAAGERALATFERRGNTWWACRTLWHLSSAANALGEWGKSLEYCRRALEHGQAVNDLRLKAVGLWRSGSAHIRRGDPIEGLRCCEEALTLSPIPFDAATARATHGYGLITRGDVAAGTTELEAAVAWFDRSNLRYTHALFSLWLVEGYLRQGERTKARTTLEQILVTSREAGYRHVEGMTNRLLAEAILGEDPQTAARCLDAARSILEEIGARSEVAKTFEAQAELRRAAGDSPGARNLLERALAIFDALGSLDGPPRVRATLASLASSQPA